MKEQAVSKTTSKEIIYSELLPGISPDAIVVFSGGLVKRERFNDTFYSTTAYKDYALGGKARVHAAADMARVYPDIPLLTLSHGQAAFPTHADVISDELQRLGIDSSRIIKDPSPYNTITEVISTINQAERHQWEDVAIISSDYHEERIMTMKDHIVELDKAHTLRPEAHRYLLQHSPSFHFIPAEKVLEAISPHYEKVIFEWKKSAGYQERLATEKEGVEAVLQGTYKIR